MQLKVHRSMEKSKSLLEQARRDKQVAEELLRSSNEEHGAALREAQTAERRAARRAEDAAAELSRERDERDAAEATA